MSEASNEVTGHTDLVGVPYSSDADKLSRAGIPSVIPRPVLIDRAHAGDDFVELDKVRLPTEI